MKEEPTDNFIGHKLILMDNKLYTRMDSPLQMVDSIIKKFRFQHVHSAVPRRKKFALILGQLYRAIDVSMTGENAIMSLLHTCVEFWLVGYGFSHFRRAQATVRSRHPYLVHLISKAIARFSQCLSLFGLNVGNFKSASLSAS